MIPIVDNFKDNDHKLPTGPRPDSTPMATKVTSSYPLMTKPNDNYDDVRAMFEMVKIEIQLLNVIQYMFRYIMFSKEVCIYKRFTNLPRNAYFTQVFDFLHIVEGVVKYKDPSTPTVEGTTMCIVPFTSRALVDFRASLNSFHYSIHSDLCLPTMKRIALCLKLGDRIVFLVNGITEDVQFWIKEFIFSVDFIIFKVHNGYSSYVHMLSSVLSWLLGIL